MNGTQNKFDITTNVAGTQTAGATVNQSGKQTDYVNLNCYIQKPGEENPEWLFRASCVPTTRKATESALKKLGELLSEKQILQTIKQILK